MAGFLGPVEVVEGIAIGTGVGQAIGDVVTPKLQGFKNERWTKYPDRPLDPEQAALAAIKGFPTALKLAEEAAKSGYDNKVFGALIENLREHPGLPLALQMWRRGYIGQGAITEYLQRGGFSDAIITALINPAGEPGGLKHERLDPAVIAVAIQRGIIDDPGFLVVAPPTGVGKVPKFRVAKIGALDEARDSGIDFERLFVETAIVGLPASNEQAANAYFRGIIELDDYYRAIAEGNTRNEWRTAILEQSRQILTANQYAELQLRGFLTAAQRRTHTAKHGMSQADSDLLFDVLGRSINVHQIVTGEARGGVYKPSPPFTFAQQIEGIPPAFLAALQRGNLRPEYYNLAYANRYTYPSFFAIRGMLTGGALTADAGDQLLLEMGWKPSLARRVADFYGQTTTATVAPEVKSAHTRALTLLRNAYVARRVDDAFAIDRLTALGIDAAVQGPLLDAWRIMQTIPGAGLTRAQVKKAFKSLPAEWPRDRALTELEDLGMEPEEAQTYLDE